MKSDLIPEVELDSKFCGYSEMRYLLDKIDTTANGNVWALLSSSECNCKIQWTSHGHTRQTKDEFDFGTARHFSFAWENGDFLALKTHQGSDTWMEVYLPLDHSTESFSIENPLAHSSEANLVVYEHLTGQAYGDTVMRIIRLKTKKEQSIIESSDTCASVFNHYCIDSASLTKDTLYYKWLTPDKIGIQNFKERRIRLYKLY